eukprot:CAMPEP_0170481250 /NCGR_PEP_ID=MMETSP0208-20121228/1767_1 /TAXON_ID=197538 /ORGANISM="Strombidium inclinatum, Strain S3" /LENGTH=98 /DNA_ID=CAMNT_0010753917 /DNA_START=8 /DNA_END=304 /DNA_ORIENTATION=+
MDQRENARQRAAATAKAAQGGRRPLGGQAPQQPKNGLGFGGEEADGWNMSPKAILLFSVAYMGCVILLHIYGKITSLKPASGFADEADPASGAEAGDL